MRCYRCNADIPDSAMICPKCGSPAHQSVANTYTYLPAGTPPWPEAKPQRPPQPLVPEQPVQPVIPKKRSTGKILRTVAVLILTPLIGIAATLGVLYGQGQFPPRAAVVGAQSPSTINVAATPTAQPTGTTTNQLPNPTSFKQTSSTDLNVSIKYPSDWQANSLQKSTEGVSEDIESQSLGIVFSIIRFSSSFNSQVNGPNDIVQNYLSNLSTAQGVNNLQTETSPNQQPTIAGTQWTELDGVFSDDNGNKIHTTVIAVEHNNTYYAIHTFLPEMYYQEATQKYIQPMLNSIQFLS